MSHERAGAALTRHKCVATMGIFSFLFGACGKTSEPSAVQSAGQAANRTVALSSAPEITAGTEEDFCDLAFFIEDHHFDPKGGSAIRAVGMHRGQSVGFRVQLSPHWQGGKATKDVPIVMYSGAVTYRSTGADSDAFVGILDQLYGSKLGPKKMKNEKRFTAISLKGNPTELSQGPVRMKLFFESDNESQYAELYTNIDLAARRLEFREKDPDYRPIVIRALCGE